MAKLTKFVNPAGEAFFVRIVLRNQYVRRSVMSQVGHFAEFLTWGWARLRYPVGRSVMVQRPSSPVREAFPGPVTAVFHAADQTTAEELRDEIGRRIESGEGLPWGAYPPPRRWPPLVIASAVLALSIALLFLLLGLTVR